MKFGVARLPMTKKKSGRGGEGERDKSDRESEYFIHFGYAYLVALAGFFGDQFMCTRPIDRQSYSRVRVIGGKLEQLRERTCFGLFFSPTCLVADAA